MSYQVYNAVVNTDMDNQFVTGSNFILADCSNGAVNIDLQQFIYDGLWLTVIRKDNVGTNTLTLTAKTGTTINGTTSVTLNPGKMAELIVYNSNWNCQKIDITF